MRRKRIVRRTAGVLTVLLVVMTVVSSMVYQAMLPQVRTLRYEGTVGRLLDGYGLWEVLAWVPVSCTFPGSQENTVCLYRVWDRPGQWSSSEYYVEEIEAPVIDRRPDTVLLADGCLSYFETLVCETSLPLSDGETVQWLNPEE